MSSYQNKQICLVSIQPTMFPMIEPDFVPPGDGSGGTGPLADDSREARGLVNGCSEAKVISGKSR